jgi:hypothetical protein
LFTAGSADILGVIATDDYFILWDRSNAFYSSTNGSTWTLYGAAFSGYNLRTKGQSMGTGSGSIVIAVSRGVDNGSSTDYYGVTFRASAGKNMVRTPNIPAQTTKAGNPAKAYMKVAS